VVVLVGELIIACTVHFIHLRLRLFENVSVADLIKEIICEKI